MIFLGLNFHLHGFLPFGGGDAKIERFGGQAPRFWSQPARRPGLAVWRPRPPYLTHLYAYPSDLLLASRYGVSSPLGSITLHEARPYETGVVRGQLGDGLGSRDDDLEQHAGRDVVLGEAGQRVDGGLHDGWMIRTGQAPTLPLQAHHRSRHRDGVGPIGEGDP